MAVSLLFLVSLLLSCLPASLSWRGGARSDSCYNMLVEHANFVRQIVPPMTCGNPCQYQLTMVGRVDAENNLLGSNSTTYQCGEIYHCKYTNCGCFILSVLIHGIPLFHTTVRLASTFATFEGFMAEARESNREEFEEGSTIWGTWIADENSSLYHAIECNRSMNSSEGPFQVRYYP